MVVADRTHRLDDVARAVGLDPHPEPDPADDRLLAHAAADQNALLALVAATAARHKTPSLSRFVGISREHATALGAAQSTPDVAAVSSDRVRALRALESAYAKAARARSADAITAVSPDLARVLASMSAGLVQCSHGIGDLR